METNRLKRFATEARNILMQGVAHRFTALGFRVDGTPVEEPQLLGGGATFMGDTVTEDFYHKWQSLAAAIRRHGLKDVAEEAAYTWFNRLMAIRIMTKNGLIPPVLQYESPSVYVPLIVSEARQGRLPQMSEEERSKLMPLLDDDSRTAEQFSLLIVAFCHATPILHRCFGHIADYTELLLPANILAEGGFVDLINHTDFIAEEDYRSSELIGWLYQFYIAEKKNEVFAAKGKFTASEIPAATQIFTPNWIVKYMVQNTVGRIYLDNNPYETEVAQDWKYLVNPSEPTPNDLIFRYDDLTDLRLADLACGSGHILGEMFDMLYTLYINEGYSRREAIEHIFRRNLMGIDIDTRAKQLAQFALLLKACQRDASFADCHCMPRVLDMPQAGLPLPADKHLATEIEAINQVLTDADTLGSIMKFSLSPAAREWVASLAEENEAAQLVLALTERYHALVMNPPYMGGGNMNAVLSNYVKKNYEAGKADLFSVFMQVCEERLVDGGKYGMINMQSWMFLSSFEKLRTHLLDTMQIDNMLHLGPRTFDELSGEVVQNTAFVLTKHVPYQAGTYYRLVDGKNCGDKERMFLAGENCYPHVSQQNFKKIPGCPIGYWVSEKMIEAMNGISIGKIAKVIAGLCTGDNAHFILSWSEVNKGSILFPNEDFVDKKFKAHNKGGDARKWYGNQNLVVKYSSASLPILQSLEGFRNDGKEYFYRESISWAKIASSFNTFRYYPKGFIFDSAGSSIFENNGKTSRTLLGFCNSVIAKEMIKIINPTINASPGIIKRLPYPRDNKDIDSLVSQNISISKSDWDAHETSWDFEENELVRLGKEQGEGPHRLSYLMEAYKEHWTEQFLRLHANEEELNRQFIEIYGLQDELTPDVPLSEVTILQQGEVKVTNEYLLTTEDGSILTPDVPLSEVTILQQGEVKVTNEYLLTTEDGSIITDETGADLTVSGKYYLDWQDDVIAKQLISYAIGCMLGRYRLDKNAILKTAKCKIFTAYNAEWLDFVVASRQGLYPAAGFDYIEGGVANDRVVDTVNLYMAGLMDAETALKRLAWHQPSNQICLLSQTITDLYLVYDGTEPAK